MEMIAHDRVGDDFDPAELGDLMYLFSEHFFRGVVEEKLAVHCSCDAVINGSGEI
jgi:hypothetical protein